MKRKLLRFAAVMLAFALVISAAACSLSPEQLEKKKGVSYDNIICRYSVGPGPIDGRYESYRMNITVYADGNVRIWTEYPETNDVLAERFTSLTDKQTEYLVYAIRENRLLAFDDCSGYIAPNRERVSFNFYDADGNEVFSCGGEDRLSTEFCYVKDLLFKYFTRTSTILSDIKEETDTNLSKLLYYLDPYHDDMMGNVFNIYVFNEEFKCYFEKYYDVPEGITVNWVINPSDQEIYYEKLDAALEEMSTGQCDIDNIIDMFIVDEDHLSKYVNSEHVISLERLGYEIPDTWYPFAVEASTASDGEHKAVPVYLCPGVLVYRRSIAKAVLGTDDPEQVQSRLDTWEKFEETAELAAEKGYYMTASFAETLRPFSGKPGTLSTGTDSRPASDFGSLQWTAQAARFLENGYTLEYTSWSDEKQDQVDKNGKAMCFFGPAWYYRYCMSPARDATFGDWAICSGPQSYSWGSNWLLACKATDNTGMVYDIFNEFSNNLDVCNALIENEIQFPNNIKAVEAYASRTDSVFDQLGGQNEYAVLHEAAMQTEWSGMNEYDFYAVDHLPDYILPCLKGEKSFDEAAEELMADMNEYFK